MKIKIFTFYLFLFTVISFAQTPQWVWSKSALNDNSSYANSVVVDKLGNTYVRDIFLGYQYF